MAAPIIGPSTTITGTGVTRKTLRRRLAEEFGMWGAFTVNATPSSSVTPDSDRQILCTALGADGVDTSQFDGAYLYVVDGTQIRETRKVLTGTFDGPIGSLLIDRPFSAALVSGTEFELLSPLPAGRHLTHKGLNECVNEALARIWVVARIAATGNGTYEYDLAAYPWLTDPDQLRQVDDAYFDGPSRQAERSPFDTRIVVSGATRTLVTDIIYSSAETFYLEVFVRADRYIYDGSSWAFATAPGLQSDTYQTSAPEEQVVAFGMCKALQSYDRMIRADKTLDKQERLFMLQDVYQRRVTWARLAARIKRESFPKPIPEPQRGIVSGISFGGWPN